MVELVGLDVFGDVAADQPDFAVLDAAVGVVQRQRAFAQALHLAADQHDAALERVEHFVLAPRLAILGDQPLVVVFAVGSVFFLAVYWAWPWQCRFTQVWEARNAKGNTSATVAVPPSDRNRYHIYTLAAVAAKLSV